MWTHSQFQSLFSCSLCQLFPAGTEVRGGRALVHFESESQVTAQKDLIWRFICIMALQFNKIYSDRFQVLMLSQSYFSLFVYVGMHMDFHLSWHSIFNHSIYLSIAISALLSCYQATTLRTLHHVPFPLGTVNDLHCELLKYVPVLTLASV